MKGVKMKKVWTGTRQLNSQEVQDQQFLCIKIKVPVQKITLKTQLSMATSLAARVPDLAIATLIQELLPFMDIFPRFL